MRLHKTLAPFLLSLLIVQWTVLPLLWQWEMAVVHEAAEAMDMNGDAETITLTRTEWVNGRTNEKEVNLDGMMYDVQSVAMDGNMVHLRVTRDTQEEELLVTGSQIGRQQHPGQQQPDAALTDIFSTVYIVPEALLHIIPIGEARERTIFHFCTAPKTRPTGCPEKPPQPAKRPLPLVG